MGRPPEVFVRPVTMAEGRRLQRIGRTAKDPVKLRRAIVVLMSAQGQAAPDIAHLLDCSPEYVRGVIHAFNGSGFAALDPKWSGGRPKTVSEHARRRICLLARCCPRDLGLAFSTWSLTKLAAYLADADELIRYDTADIAAAVRELTGGQGVSVVHDGVGAATFVSSMASLRRRGYLVLFRASSGPVGPLDVERLNSAGSPYLTRPTLGHYTQDRGELLDRHQRAEAGR